MESWYFVGFEQLFEIFCICISRSAFKSITYSFQFKVFRSWTWSVLRYALHMMFYYKLCPCVTFPSSALQQWLHRWAWQCGQGQWWRGWTAWGLQPTVREFTGFTTGTTAIIQTNTILPNGRWHGNGESTFTGFRLLPRWRRGLHDAGEISFSHSLSLSHSLFLSLSFPPSGFLWLSYIAFQSV